VVIAGPLFSRTLKNIGTNLSGTFQANNIPEDQLGFGRSSTLITVQFSDNGALRYFLCMFISKYFYLLW
ncbi:MAG: hypothetical protein ACKOW9_01960, partial [Candidatus Paceibacterota bacterium]